MPNCILRYCKNHSSKIKKYSEGITFHKFPRLGHEKREQWIKFVQNNRSEDTWLPSEHSCICSEHFRKQDYYFTKTGRRYLKKCAVPQTTVLEVPLENNKHSEDEGNASPNSLLNVDVSDSEPIFDTPKIIELKIKLNKITVAKRKIDEKYKKIKRMCRYLKSRNHHLIKMVNQLKTQIPVENCGSKSNFITNVASSTGK